MGSDKQLSILQLVMVQNGQSAGFLRSVRDESNGGPSSASGAAEAADPDQGHNRLRSFLASLKEPKSGEHPGPARPPIVDFNLNNLIEFQGRTKPLGGYKKVVPSS